MGAESECAFIEALQSGFNLGHLLSLPVKSETIDVALGSAAYKVDRQRINNSLAAQAAQQAGPPGCEP